MKTTITTITTTIAIRITIRTITIRTTRTTLCSAPEQPALHPHTVHGMSDVKRLLYTVQQQRKEHRKLQRLMLDTSGHALTLYETLMQQQQVRRCEEF